MLVFCYGMRKSASTFGFDLIREVLAQNGHPQHKIDHPAVAPRRGNFTQNFDQATFVDLNRRIGEHRLLAIKTHAGPAPWVRQWVVERRALAFASFRDPRDIAVALLDAGRRSRQMGYREFARFHDLEDVHGEMPQHIAQFNAWREIPGVMLLGYDQVAFQTAATLQRIAGHLDLPVRTRPILFKFATGRQIPHFNQGIPGRHASVLTAEETARFDRDYADFITFCRDHQVPVPTWLSLRNRAHRSLRRWVRTLRAWAPSGRT